MQIEDVLLARLAAHLADRLQERERLDIANRASDLHDRQIAGVMVAEVCSIYIKRQDGSLELFASEGLNPSSVHTTRLKRGEGLVGRASELGVTVNEPEASSHPAFSYRPETGEEIYHSLLAVPISRSGQVLGVLVILFFAVTLVKGPAVLIRPM